VPKALDIEAWSKLSVRRGSMI